MEGDVGVALPGLALGLVYDLESRLDHSDARLSNEAFVGLVVEPREEHRHTQPVFDDALVCRAAAEGGEQQAVGS